MARWRFSDPVNLDEYVFDVNPNSQSPASYKKQVTYENTAAPDGLVIMMEGRDETQQLSFEGTILDQEQYEAMVDWFGRRHQIEVTDDLDRTSTIYITAFEATRERALHHPWKHKYTVRYTVIDWPT